METSCIDLEKIVKLNIKIEKSDILEPEMIDFDIKIDVFYIYVK
jgi:hypothetical protein